MFRCIPVDLLDHHGQTGEGGDAQAPARSALLGADSLICSCRVLTLWKFALYSAFVAVMVFYIMKVDRNKWVLLAIIILQICNLVATIGAYGTSGTFVPLGLLSADNVKSWEVGAIDAVAPGATCSAYYGNFFNVESVELQHEGHDPLVKFTGYCSDNWMTTVGSTIAAKTMIQLFMLMCSLQLLGAQLGGQDDQLKAVA